MWWAQQDSNLQPATYVRDAVTCPLSTATISEFEPTFDTFPILSVRSEEISQIWVVWGKAVALSRYHRYSRHFGTH